MALRIFLISFVKLGDYKDRKVTEPDVSKKLLIWRYSRKRLQINPKSDTLIFGWWLVGNAVISETALRIFLIFCMRLGDYKGRKVTGLDFWKKFFIWRLISNCFLTIRRSSQCILVCLQSIMLSISSSRVLYIMMSPMTCQPRNLVTFWVLWVPSLGSSFQLSYPCPSRSFLGIGCLVCSEIVHGVRDPNGNVRDSVRYLEKKNCPRNGANGQKIGKK